MIRPAKRRDNNSHLISNLPVAVRARMQLQQTPARPGMQEIRAALQRTRTQIVRPATKVTQVTTVTKVPERKDINNHNNRNRLKPKPKLPSPHSLLPISGPSSEEEINWTVENWPEILRNAYVISIRPERLQGFQDRVGPLMRYVTTFGGIDGRSVDVEDLKKRNKYKPSSKWNELTRGEIGCFLSHKAVWKKFLEGSASHACIMEDDLDLRPRRVIVEHIQTALQELAAVGRQWELLFLSRNPGLISGSRSVTPHCMTAGRAWGLFFYVLSRSGAKKLLQASATITQAADIYTSTILNGLVLYPRVCSIVAGNSDTIGIK